MYISVAQATMVKEKSGKIGTPQGCLCFNTPCKTLLAKNWNY